MNPVDITPHLNHLVKVNKNAEAGFRTAAQSVANSELETLFDKYAKQHGKFAVELQQEIKRLGGSESDSGTWDAAIHRAWMNLKSAVSGHSPTAILASCEDGEESAQAAYEDAVKTNFTGQPHALIERQLQQIKEVHTHLVRLTVETKAGLEFPKNE